jgi:hypothetical protein
MQAPLKLGGIFIAGSLHPSEELQRPFSFAREASPEKCKLRPKEVDISNPPKKRLEKIFASYIALLKIGLLLKLNGTYTY